MSFTISKKLLNELINKKTFKLRKHKRVTKRRRKPKRVKRKVVRRPSVVVPALDKSVSSFVPMVGVSTPMVGVSTPMEAPRNKIYFQASPQTDNNLLAVANKISQDRERTNDINKIVKEAETEKKILEKELVDLKKVKSQGYDVSPDMSMILHELRQLNSFINSYRQPKYQPNHQNIIIPVPSEVIEDVTDEYTHPNSKLIEPINEPVHHSGEHVDDLVNDLVDDLVDDLDERKENKPSSSSSKSSIEIENEEDEEEEEKPKKKEIDIDSELIKKISDSLNNNKDNKLKSNERKSLTRLAEKYKVNDTTSKLKKDKRTIRDIIQDVSEKINDNDISGEGHKMSHDGLSNLQIDKMLKKYPEYLGCISHDEIESVILPKVKPRSIGFFVINTDPASKPGRHWQSVWFDGKKTMEIDFFDSFGDKPDKKMLSGLKQIAHKLDADTYLKFKENRIKLQDDRTSNCGFFAVKFCIDKMNGKHFQQASGWDDHIKILSRSREGEKEIKKFKTQMGYGPWKYIPSFIKKGVDTVKALIFGREKAPPAVRQLLEKYGNEKVSNIRVGRVPVNKVITSILNIISGGQIEQNRVNLNYDQIYHLYLIITLQNGYSFKIERNESVHVSGPSLPSGSEVMNAGTPAISLNELIENGANGNSTFWQYSATNSNCQMFCHDILSKNGLLTNELNQFIMQNASALLEHSPLTSRIANAITDFGSKLHILIHGAKRKI